MRRRPVLAAVGTVAILVAGYAAAGTAGLIDAASAAGAGVLIVARGLVQGEQPRSVRPQIPWPRRPAVSTAEFPGYRKIFSDLSWAQVSWRHYEHPLRPMLVRLAEALDRQEALDRLEALDRQEAAALTRTGDRDGPGPDLAALDRVISSLEVGRDQ